jgi:Uma2 family endonuclease
MEITELGQLDLTKTYSYADYYSWKFQERVELLRGKIMQMSPAPSRVHQTLQAKIGTKLYNFLENQPCEMFYAPFDVRLERVKDDKNVQNVVQPDICVVCDISKLDDRGCSGAPELIVEILSPGNTKKEMKYKFELYEAAGVLEYWIVDPTEKVIFQYVLENKQFTNHRPLIEEDTIQSVAIAGFSMTLVSIF